MNNQTCNHPLCLATRHPRKIKFCLLWIAYFLTIWSINHLPDYAISAKLMVYTHPVLAVLAIWGWTRKP